jgi:DNA-binding NtrC family response regulator
MTRAITRQLNVLVVDDDEELRRAVTDILLLEDHQVTSVADGNSALKLIGAQHFDLLVTDLGMPEMTGLELCNLAGELDPSLKAILITGIGAHLTEQDTANPLLLGVVLKPFRINQLRALVKLLD